MRPKDREPPLVQVPAPGLRVEPEPRILATVVGSCVAVCAFELGLGLGGMAHFVLPRREAEGRVEPIRYGDEAVALLVRKLVALGASRARLIARIAGGGRPPWLAGGFTDVGVENIRAARDALRAERVPLLEEQVGGEAGRALRFRTDTGSLVVEAVRSPPGYPETGPPRT